MSAVQGRFDGNFSRAVRCKEHVEIKGMIDAWGGEDLQMLTFPRLRLPASCNKEPSPSTPLSYPHSLVAGVANLHGLGNVTVIDSPTGFAAGFSATC